MNDPNKIVTVRGLNAHGQLVKDPLYYGSPIAPAMKTDLEWPAGEVPIMLSGHRRHVCYQFNKTGQVKCYGEDGNKAPKKLAPTHLHLREFGAAIALVGGGKAMRMPLQNTPH